MTTYIRNKKARFDFEILEEFEAGVVLSGHEVKSIRAGKGKLDGAHVKLYDGEAVLIGSSISPYQVANTPKDYEPERARQLLFKKKELAHLERELTTARLTIVPISWYDNSGKIKLKVGLARGKKKADKRESIKARDTKRDIDRELKGR